MDLFKDKKFDGFDELTQLIEPFIFPVNDLVSRLPTEEVLTMVDIISLRDGKPANDSSYTTPIDAIVYFARKNKMVDDIDYETKNLIKSFFKFEIAEGTQFDLSNNTMVGEIKVVRKRDLLNDEEIMSFMLDKFHSRLNDSMGKASNVPAARFHELAESFGFLEDMKKHTTFKERRILMRDRMVGVIKHNEVRIRDYALAMRFAEWIRSYLIDGNLAALKNIALMKIVSYEGKAIYSINEEKL